MKKQHRKKPASFLTYKLKVSSNLVVDCKKTILCVEMVLSPIIFVIVLFSFRKVRRVLCSNQCDFPNKLTVLKWSNRIALYINKASKWHYFTELFSSGGSFQQINVPYFFSITYILSNMQCSALVIQFLYLAVLY